MMATLSPDDLNKLSKSQLIDLINRGIVNVMTLPGMTLPMSKYDTAEYKQYENLKGIGISISAAERKYNVPNPTIVRWVKKGIIQRLGMDRNRVLIDEADMAYCSLVYHRNEGQGRWLFNDDGTPYVKK